MPADIKNEEPPELHLLVDCDAQLVRRFVRMKSIPGNGRNSLLPEYLGQLLDRLRVALRPEGIGEISLLHASYKVADDPLKLLLHWPNGKPRALIKVSVEAAPQLVRREAEMARQTRELLGPELGRHIPDTIWVGEIEGLSYLVRAYYETLSGSRWISAIQKFWLRPRLFEWLRQVTAKSLVDATDEEIEQDFIIPLKKIADDAECSRDVREMSKRALSRAEQGSWRPRYVLAHGDLWKDNVFLLGEMTLPSSLVGLADFVVIDWAGAMVKGHAIMDLIRLARSLGLSRQRLRQELITHCDILRCEVVDAAGYLAAAIGYLGMHLEHFPRNRYLALAESCCESVVGALG